MDEYSYITSLRNLYVMFCLIFFIGYTLEKILDRQKSNICSGEILTAVCIMDGENAFVWSVAPFFTGFLIFFLS